jgi:hypothetical protein
MATNAGSLLVTGRGRLSTSPGFALGRLGAMLHNESIFGIRDLRPFKT